MTGIGANTSKILYANSDAGRALPAPDETWVFGDIEAIDRSALRLFINAGVVDRLGRVHLTNERRTVYEYRTDRSVYKWVQANLSDQDLMPCGHRPLRNLADGGFSCLNDDCDAEFSREVAEAVTGWESSHDGDVSVGGTAERLYWESSSVESVQPGDRPEIRTDGGEAVDTESDEPDPPSWQWEGASAPDGSHILTGYSNEGRFSLRLRDEDLMFLRDWANRSLDMEGGEQA